MKCWQFLCLSLGLVIFSNKDNVVYAQQLPLNKDSVIGKNNPYPPGKSKFTKFVYNLLFSPNININHSRKKVFDRLIQKPYAAYEDKVIRHITIEVLDPFGSSIAEAIVANQNLVVRTGNNLHVKSRVSNISNLLLFRQYQEFDSLLVKESERLIRNQSYIRDVSFFVNVVSKFSDSVDIVIREHDKWSILPAYSTYNSYRTFGIRENNFLGLGHAFINSYTWNESGKNGFKTSYSVPNICRTYINATALYGLDEYRIFTRSIDFSRPFYSPYTKIAGGVNFTYQNRKDTIQGGDSIVFVKPFSFDAQDVWAGKAVQVFKGKSENQRSTNFISTFRYYTVHFNEKPLDIVDTFKLYADQNFYLGSIGISTRKYVRDKFIFNFGITEIVPIGRVFSLTAGYQQLNDQGRMYIGARASYGNYYGFGYLSASLEYGTFVRKVLPEQGAVSGSIVYFTGLLEIGRWKFRQFIKPQVIIGLNRFPYESLTINEEAGINGFRSNFLSGTSRILCSFQTQSYAPWDFIGFRFGPYFTYSLGVLGTSENGFKNSHLYSQFGLGVLIKNLNLVFNTFQISLVYYPSIPGVGDNVFKFNSYKTSDFALRNFEIGKPGVVSFE